VRQDITQRGGTLERYWRDIGEVLKRYWSDILGLL